MAKNKQHGFSLIELMVVVLIIGVFAAMTIPSITTVMHRNALSELTNAAQEAGINVRSWTMQTRQASVLEVRHDKAWINLLAGSYCNDERPLARRCMSPEDSSGLGEIVFSEVKNVINAGAAVCGGSVLTLAGDSCTLAVALDRSDGFALCYSGNGELYYRLGADDAVACTQDPAQPSDDQTWVPACSAVAAVDATGSEAGTGAQVKLNDGAVLVFNRFGGDPLCTGTPAEGAVRRAVFFPTIGAPFVKVQ